MAGPNNLRIIYNNIADLSTTTITPSSTQSAVVTTANLVKDTKGLVWRSATNTAVAQTVKANLLVDFATGGTPTIIGGVALPFTNLSSLATIRVRGYNTPAPPVLGGTIPLPTITENTTIGTNINAAVYGNGMYVAVGTGGRCMISIDGLSWSYRPGLEVALNDNTQDALCIWWTGSRFVVGCTNGYTAVSYDGINWTVSLSLRGTTWGTTASVNTISRLGAGNLVVSGTGGKVATSPDGVTWTYQAGLSGTAFGASTVFGLAWNGTTMVAAGVSGKVATSTDAVTWTNQTGLSSGTFSTSNCTTLVWAGTKFIVTGVTSKCATSPDGVTWTYQAGLSAASGWASLTTSALYFDGTNAIVSSTTGKVAISTDGVTWTGKPNAFTISSGSSINAIVYTSPVYVLLGATAFNMYTIDLTSYTSNTTASIAAGFSNTALFDTGNVLCSPWNTLNLPNWGTNPVGSNTYAYGGGTYARNWIPAASQIPCTFLVVEIIDTLPYWQFNTYIEASRLVIGNYWTPKYNTSYGLSAAIKDLSSSVRTESGDSVTRRAPRYNTVNFDLKYLDVNDRVQITQILLGNGLSKPMFISLFPDNGGSTANWEKERAHQIYGKYTSLPGLTFNNPFTYSTTFDIEEV